MWRWVWSLWECSNESMYGSTHMIVHYPVVSHYGTGKNAQPHSLSQVAHILTEANGAHWETTAYNTPLKPTQCIRYLGAAPLSKVVPPNIGYLFGTFYEKMTHCLRSLTENKRLPHCLFFKSMIGHYHCLL